MKFSKDHHGSESKIGGEPTLLAEKKPWTEVENDIWGFLLQIEVKNLIPELPKTAYIQLYQSILEGDEPCPKAILIPENSLPNKQSGILVHPRATKWDISFTKKQEPETLPTPSMLPEYIELFSSKVGGLDPYEMPNYTFLAQIGEDADLNFGGMMCSIYLNSLGKIITELN